MKPVLLRLLLASLLCAGSLLGGTSDSAACDQRKLGKYSFHIELKQPVVPAAEVEFSLGHALLRF